MTNDAPYTPAVGQRYRKQAKKFFHQHPDLRSTYDHLLADLVTDPFAPGLKIHALSGRLKGVWAVSLTYPYRITLTLLISEKEITLLEIGDHDDVYR